MSAFAAKKTKTCCLSSEKHGGKDVFRFWQVNLHCSSCARCHRAVATFAKVSSLHQVSLNVIFATGSDSPTHSCLEVSIIHLHFSRGILKSLTVPRHVTCKWGEKGVSVAVFAINAFLKSPKIPTFLQYIWKSFQKLPIFSMFSICSFSLNGKAPTVMRGSMFFGMRVLRSRTKGRPGLWWDGGCKERASRKERGS